MTLFEAPTYDPAHERRRKFTIAAVILIVVAIAAVAFVLRNWPEEHAVSQFFDALQHQQYEKAYGIWVADPNWKQHPDKHSRYSYNEFYYRDWGPGGDWGLIKNFHIDGSVRPKNGSGVIVQVTVNGRAEPARIWVEKSDKSLTFSPF
jgi:hypothetical protein